MNEYKMAPRGKGKMGKRVYKRRGKGRSRPKTTLANRSNLSPVPARFVTKMKYAEAVTVTGAGLQKYYWNLNSLFDPNQTGTGHQPYGFDQLCGPTGVALYNRYRVYKVDYVLTVANDSYNIHYGVLPNNAGLSLIGNVSEMRENPRAQYAVQNPGGTLKKITGTISLPALVGRTKSQYMADDRYQAVYNASPDESMTLGCFSQGLNDDTGVSMSHTFNIMLVYHCEFFDPHALDQS